MDYFSALQPREQLVLKLGAIALVPILSLMFLLPKWDSYSLLKTELDGLQSDIMWLNEQRATVEKFANNCPKVNKHNTENKNKLSNLLRRNQLQVESISQEGEKILFSVSGKEGNQFLKSIYAISCQGYSINEVSLVLDANDPDILNANFGVQRAK
jgi:type II secretory pathway component PulM